MQDNDQQPVQPAQPEYRPQPVAQPTQSAAAPSKGLAIASMVLGIVALLLALIWFIAVPAAITALVLGIVYLVKNRGIRGGKGMAITGIVLSAVALVIAILMTLLVFIALPELQGSQRDSARKNDLSIMSSQVALYQSNNRGMLPEVSYLDTDELTVVTEVSGSGSATDSVAVYEVGTDCEGTPSEGSYNLTIQLEDGTEYCTDF